MATHVAGIIRVASVADLQGPGGTDSALRRAIAPIRIPEGRYGPLHWSIINDQTNSHDQQWGYWTIRGDLAEFGDSEPVREYWRQVILAISETQYIGVTQGGINVLVDGQPSLMIDHFGAITEGMETVGDE